MQEKMTRREVREAKARLRKEHEIDIAFLRDHKGLPRITRATLKKNGKVVAIGYAVCSASETQVIRNKGVNIAVGRALEALVFRVSRCRLNMLWKAADVLDVLPESTLAQDAQLSNTVKNEMPFYKAVYVG